MAKKRKRVIEFEESEQYLDLKTYLLNQLTKNENNVVVYRELVDEYMDLWITSKLLSDDILSRGTKIRWKNGKNQSGYKKNESVQEKIKVNQQMLQILDKIGISPDKCGDPDEENDDTL